MRSRATHPRSSRVLPMSDEYFSTFTHRASLEDQLRRFRDGHEVSYHVRVGHRDGATAGDLLLKRGITEPELPMTLPNLTAMNRVG